MQSFQLETTPGALVVPSAAVALLSDTCRIAEYVLEKEHLAALRSVSDVDGFGQQLDERRYIRIHAFDRNGLVIALGIAQKLACNTERPAGRAVVMKTEMGETMAATGRSLYEAQLCFDRSESTIGRPELAPRVLICFSRHDDGTLSYTEVDLGYQYVTRIRQPGCRTDRTIDDRTVRRVEALSANRILNGFSQLWCSVMRATGAIDPKASDVSRI